MVARQRQRRQPRRQHRSRRRARARLARARRRAALQHRRLGGDHRRRARVRAGGRARSAASPSTEATRRITLHAPLAGRHAAGDVSRTPTFPKRATCACAAGSQRGVVLAAATNGGTTVLHRTLTRASSTGLITCRPRARRCCSKTASPSASRPSVAKGFRAGDYWVFAARTADASVELLDAAPPRGIHHHYARLALWDAGTHHRADGLPPSVAARRRRRLRLHAVRDARIACQRHSSPSRTRCTACKDTGGTVCLHAGQYALRAPVRLTGARSVRIKGQGPATVLESRRAVRSASRAASRDRDRESRHDFARQAAGHFGAHRARASRCRTWSWSCVANPMRAVPAIALSGAIAGLTIRDNLIVGPDRHPRARSHGAPKRLKFLMHRRAAHR